MKRFPFFFFVSAVAVLAMIGIALLPLMPKSATAIEAKADGAALVYGAAALNSITGAQGFPVTPAPGPRGDQSGPRLASQSALEPGAVHSKGARLLFGPKTQSVLGNGALTIRISGLTLANNPTRQMAVGIVRGGAVKWVSSQIKTGQNIVEFELPAGNTPAQALAIWPSTAGEGRGIELQSIAFFRRRGGV